MKTRPGELALFVPIALTVLTGCDMTDDGKTSTFPSAGTSTTGGAVDAAKKVSSEMRDLIYITGRTSNSGAGVADCSGKESEKFFQIFHPWRFAPASADQLDGVMRRLEEELPKHGWKVVEYGTDGSQNKNTRLTADHDEKKHSVKIVHFAKDEVPNLNLMVVSGCYQVPEGEKVDRY